MPQLLKIIISIALLLCGSIEASSLKELFSNKIDHFTVEDGLPENSVRCIEKDQYGNYWICTNFGLVRYDGYEFENILKDRNYVEIQRSIRDLKIINNLLYIATESGLYTLDLNTGLFSRIELGDYENAYIYKVLIRGNEVLLGTNYGLIVLINNQVSQIAPSHDIRDLLEINNTLLISSIHNGLYKLSLNDLETNSPEKIFGDEQTYILQIKQVADKVYVSTYGNGLYILDLEFNVLAHLQKCTLDICLPSNFVNSVDVISGDLVVSTRIGLVKLDNNYDVYEKFLPSSVINDKYLTDSVKFITKFSDSTWVGLSPGGLIRINKNNPGIHSYAQFNQTRSSLDTGVYSIGKLHDRILVGTYNGLFYLERNSNNLKRVKSIPDTFRLTAICNLSLSEVLLSEANGVYLYDFETDDLSLLANTESQLSLDNRCVQGKSIFSFGTRVGILSKDDVSQDLLQFQTNDRVKSVASYNNYIYVSTNSFVFTFRIEENQINLVNQVETFNTVLFFKKSNDKLFAFTLYDFFEVQGTKLVKSKYELPDKYYGLSIYGAEFVDDDMWLTTNDGILKLTRENSVEIFSEIHGLGDREFNSKATFYDKSEDTLYFGGLTKLTSINLTKLDSSELRSADLISKVSVIKPNGDTTYLSYIKPYSLEINEGDSIEITLGRLESPKRRELDFYYSQKDFFSESEIKLHPKQRTIRLDNINSFDLLLDFPFSNYSLDVYVNPVPWKRWWALSIYLMLLTTITYLAFKQYQRVQVSRQNEIFIKKQLNSKRQQLASISHELRTPLNSIIGILYSSEIDEEKRDYLRSSSLLLRSLIDNVLNTASSEVGNELTLDNSVIDIRENLDSAIQILKPYLVSADITYILNVDKKIPQDIFCDGTKLQQVVINLVKNSVKHALTATKVSINVSRELNMIKISISDDGIGIPEDSQQKVFDVFHKDIEHSSGFGLGLHISKKICQRMGGDLILDRKYQDGARFIMTFAFEDASDTSSEDRNKQTLIKGNQKKLLILEDDPLNSYALKLLLNKVEHTDYIMCETLEEFNDTYNKSFEVIILDLNFGAEINGVQLASDLRINGFTGEVFIHSAETAPEVIEESKNSVTKYLIKPIKLSELEEITFNWN